MHFQNYDISDSGNHLSDSVALLGQIISKSPGMTMRVKSENPITEVWVLNSRKQSMQISFSHSIRRMKTVVVS